MSSDPVHASMPEIRRVAELALTKTVCDRENAEADAAVM